MKRFKRSPITTFVLNHRRALATASVLASTAMLGTTSSASLITNGSFEAPDIPSTPAPNLVTGTPTGWTGSPQIVDASAADPSVLQAHSGSQYVNLLPRPYPPFSAPGTPISQTFSTLASGQYVLSWADNVFSPSTGGGGNVQYTLALSGSDLSSPMTIDVHTSTSWNLRSLDLTLDAGPHTLTFSSAVGLSLSLDSVSLTERIPSTPPTGVPDTGNASAWLGAAIGSLLVCSRRMAKIPVRS